MMRTKDEGEGGLRVIMVLRDARFCFLGPQFRGDPNLATSEDEGVVVVEPGTPIRIDLETAKKVLAEYEGEILEGSAIR
jgi:hypothetical protein